MNAMEMAWREALDAQNDKQEKAGVVTKRAERRSRAAEKAAKSKAADLARSGLMQKLQATLAASGKPVVYVEDLDLTDDEFELAKATASTSRGTFRKYLSMAHLKRLMLKGV